MRVQPHSHLATLLTRLYHTIGADEIQVNKYLRPWRFQPLTVQCRAGTGDDLTSELQLISSSCTPWCNAKGARICNLVRAAAPCSASYVGSCPSCQ